MQRRPEFVVVPLALPSFGVQGLPPGGIHRLVERAGDVALHGQLTEVRDDPARLRPHGLLHTGGHVLRPQPQVDGAVDDPVLPVKSRNRR